MNRKPCVANGVLSRGATCAETITGVTSQLSMTEALDMIERSDTHPPAVWQSADDYGEETTEIQEACRLLGDSCSYELKKTIENRKAILDQARSFQ